MREVIPVTNGGFARINCSTPHLLPKLELNSQNTGTTREWHGNETGQTKPYIHIIFPRPLARDVENQWFVRSHSLTRRLMISYHNKPCTRMSKVAIPTNSCSIGNLKHIFGIPYIKRTVLWGLLLPFFFFFCPGMIPG